MTLSVECDQCEVRKPRTLAEWESWLRVGEGKDPLHFCGWSCLSRYAQDRSVTTERLRQVINKRTSN